MLKSLLSSHPFLRSHLQKILDKTHSSGRGLWDSFGQANSLVYWQFKKHLGCQSMPLRPLIFRRCSHQLQYTDELILFSRSWKERSSCIQFSHDHSKSKHIHRRVVVATSHQYFWCSIPPRSNILGKRWFSPNLPGKSKICQFDSIIDLKQILWFEISVKVTLPVKIGQSLQCLIDHVSDIDMIELSSLLLQLINIAIEILKYKIELIIFLDKLQQLHNIRMMQFAEDAHLIQSNALVPITVLLLHTFNSNQLASEFVDSLDNTAETTVSQFVAQFVFIHSKIILQNRYHLFSLLLTKDILSGYFNRIK